MRSSILFFVVVSAFVVSFAALLIFGFEGGFGGRGPGAAMGVPRSFWLILFVVPLVVAISVLGYVLVFPELGGEKPVLLRAELCCKRISAGKPVFHESRRTESSSGWPREELFQPRNITTRTRSPWQTGL